MRKIFTHGVTPRAEDALSLLSWALVLNPHRQSSRTRPGAKYGTPLFEPSLCCSNIMHDEQNALGAKNALPFLNPLIMLKDFVCLAECTQGRWARHLF